MLDRSSFQRFGELECNGRMPDAKTLWVGRERLKQQDLIGDSSEAMGPQLPTAGFIARGGQSIDASIVSVAIYRNRHEGNATIDRGQVPDDWNSRPARAERHGCALSKKAWQVVLRLQVEREYGPAPGFIRRLKVTTASVNDATVFEKTLDETNTSRDVYAGRGYTKVARTVAARGGLPRPHRSARIRRAGR